MRFLVGAAFLALVAAGCGGGAKSLATTTSTTVSAPTRVTVTGKYRYPPAVISRFMQSCMQGDVAKQGYCACVIDKLSNTVSTRDFARIARTRKATPRVVSAIRRATAVCGGTG